jgi:hypothetical protein
MATRTAKLASAKPGAGSFTTVATVPSATTYIVKSLLIFQNSGVTADVRAYASDATNVFAYLFFNQSVPSGTRQEWEGFLVLAPGDTLTVFSSQTNVSFWFSGSKLPGVAA